MVYSVVYEYKANAEIEQSVEAFLFSDQIFEIGGFTLRPSFRYSNRPDSKPEFISIKGKPGFFSSSNLSDNVISSISSNGVASQQRSGKEGNWLHLASFIFESEPEDNISVKTDIISGDFFLSSGENISATQDDEFIKTKLYNATGSIQIQGNFTLG